MTKYRKKPIVIEANQWHDKNVMPPAPADLLRKITPHNATRSRWELKTLEGWYVLMPGDYIICGIQGEFYPCKPDIFDQTYEAVKD